MRLLSLSVEGDTLTPADLQFLERLRNVAHLRVRGRSLDTGFLEYLKRWSSLSDLVLEFTAVRGDHLNKLKSLPELSTLRLFGVKLDETAVESLCDMKFDGVVVFDCELSQHARDFLRTADLPFEFVPGELLDRIRGETEEKADR